MRNAGGTRPSGIWYATKRMPARFTSRFFVKCRSWRDGRPTVSFPRLGRAELSIRSLQIGLGDVEPDDLRTFFADQVD